MEPLRADESNNPRNPQDAAAQQQRIKFPNALARDDLQSPTAWVRRHLVLFVLYAIWIGGTVFFTAMTFASLAVLLYSLATLGQTPIPPWVQVFTVAMVTYYSYHYVSYDEKNRQGEWPLIKQFARFTMAKFSYFHHQITIMEDRESESLAYPDRPMVPAKAKTMFSCHPHGILSSGYLVNGTLGKRFEESNAHWLVSDVIFWFPILRDILHWLQFDDVSKQTFVRHMSQDENLCLIPGGFEEATLFARGKHRVFIKQRFGFIKLALQYGYKVAPVYTFGEEQTFHSFDYFLKQRMLLNKWKVPAVVFFGRLGCFFMPREDVELITVVGKPLELPKIEHPTKEDVAKYHKLYVDALVGLFERNKHKYAVDPTVPLEVY